MTEEGQNARSTSGLTRRDFLRQSSVAAAATPFLGTPPETKTRPNVILIISDQFRWDCIGANGLNPLNLTPNLDAIAAEGTNFSNAITNQPVCSPSRASLFTGCY